MKKYDFPWVHELIDTLADADEEREFIVIKNRWGQLPDLLNELQKLLALAEK